MKNRILWGLAGLLAGALLAASAQAKDLNGAGGTAIYPVLAKWADAYHSKTGIAVNYQAIGSGGGIKQITAKTIDFANSDKPLKPDELAKMDVAQFPAVIISITPVVNLPGMKPGELVLDGPTLADIYLGKVAYWDAAAIRKLNPHVTLPHMGISVVHRSDGSGTTFNFTNYLGKVSPEWDQKVGADVSVDWPVGVGGKGNAGVASNVQQIKGSIGYVEYAYAKQNKLTFTKMVNKEGKTVSPTSAAFAAAAGNAKWDSQPGYGVILANQPGADSWPMTAATWILIHKQPADPAAAADALKFFGWAYDKGAKMADELDYIAMPKNVADSVKSTWSKDIKGADGKPLYGM